MEAGGASGFRPERAKLSRQSKAYYQGKESKMKRWVKQDADRGFNFDAGLYRVHPGIIVQGSSWGCSRCRWMTASPLLPFARRCGIAIPLKKREKETK
jgi:hypothetical protein